MADRRAKNQSAAAETKVEAAKEKRRMTTEQKLEDNRAKSRKALDTKSMPDVGV